MICPECGALKPDDDGFTLCSDCDARRGISHERYTVEKVSDVLAEIRGLSGDMYEGTITLFIDRLYDYADRIEEAYKREMETPHPNFTVACASVAMDFGRAGVATVHHYEVRETMAGRCNLVATFTDPHRAAEYAERIAREG